MRADRGSEAGDTSCDCRSHSAAAHTALCVVMCDVSTFVARAEIKGTEEVSQLQQRAPPGNTEQELVISGVNTDHSCHRILPSYWSILGNAGYCPLIGQSWAMMDSDWLRRPWCLH